MTMYTSFSFVENYDINLINFLQFLKVKQKILYYLCTVLRKI